MTGSRNFNVMHLDVLTEIGNIGIGNAATSLSQLLNDRINMTVPKACFLPYEEIISLAGGPEEQVTCINLEVEGDIPGIILYIFNQESTFSLVDVMLGNEPGTTKELDTMGESVIMEIGNILTGSFVGAISTMAQLNMLTSVPLFAQDMLAAVLVNSLVNGGHVDDRVLLIETKLSIKHKEIKGHFFMLTEPYSLKKLFTALGINL